MTAEEPHVNLPDLGSDLSEAPVARIGTLHRRLRYRLDARLERYGITGVQWGLLSHLAHEDGLSQAELQRRMAIEAATLTHIVQRLERDGWIRRAGDPEDRRRQIVRLTSKSLDLMPEIAIEVGEHRRNAQRGLDEVELALLADLLRRIEENVL